MSDPISTRHGVRVFVCAADGPRLAGERDVLDVIGEAYGQDAGLIAIPVRRLDEAFFTLSTRIAGEIMQKFVNYRVRLAIVGDIGRHLEASSALRDFVRETNRGRQVWFVADLDELDAKLAREIP